MRHWGERVLVLSPHADDETLGCGGMIATLRARGSAVKVMVAEVDRHGETKTVRMDRIEELRAAMRELGVHEWSHFSQPTERPDAIQYRSTIGVIDEAVDDFKPTAVFFPYPSHHQDHRRMYEATLAAMRPRPKGSSTMLAAYEYPYIDQWPPPTIIGGRFVMNVGEGWDAKERALNAYRTQINENRYLTVERSRALANWRGAEIGAEYGEAFYLIRGELI